MASEQPRGDGPEFWLFGYGSLIWKPPPHFDRRIPGWVNGYVRRFWQKPFGNSQDHRGTPESPGRVVTLIERSYWEALADHHQAAPERVWGTGYRIKQDKVDEVKEYLDIREINGYTIHYTPFYPADGGGGPPIRTLVYIGTPENDQFTGVQDPQSLAEHISRSRGPSGLNTDYLFSLEKALGELSTESGDVHVTDLSDRVRAVLESRRRGAEDGLENSIMTAPLPASQELGHFQQDHSVEEQEETEKIE